MARIHQAIILVIFACFSGSISKRHHHHRFHHSLLHGMKGLNLGEHMQFFTNESDYKRLFEIAKKKDDIMEVENNGDKRAGEETIDQQLTEINKQIKQVMENTAKKPDPSMMTQALSSNFDDPLKDIKSITGGVEKAFPGLKSLAEGIRAKDGFKIATSALTIASAIAVAAGGPIGLVVATVLNFAAVMIDIFKPVEAKESQEEMLERVISEALQGFRQSTLVAAFAGFTKKREMVESNLREVVQFLGMSINDIGTNNDLEKYVKTDANGKEAREQNLRFKRLKYVMVNEILPMANEVMYDGVNTLGKIEHQINEVCDMDKKITEDDKQEAEAQKCLKMLELYSEMSFQRRFTYLSQLSTTLKKVIESKDVDDLTRAKALVHLRLISDNVRETHDQDVKVLDFLVKPIYSFKRRYTINYFYSNNHEYRYLNTYLNSLSIKSTHGVFVCSKEALLGSCKELPLSEVPSTGEKSFDFSKENFVPMSLIVPDEYIAKVDYGSKGKITKPVIGYGPTTISSLVYTTLKEGKVKAIVVSKSSTSVDFSILQMCRLNSSPKQDEESVKILRPPHLAICKEILTNKYEKEDFSGSDTEEESSKWKNTYKSFNIPSNIAVIGKSIHNKKTFYWGPFYGSTVIPKACGSLMWTTVIIIDYNDPNQLKAYKKETDALCKLDSTLDICQLENVDGSTQFLQMCKEEDLNGFCDKIPIRLDSNDEQIVDLDYIHVNAYEDADKGKKVKVDFSKEKEKSWFTVKLTLAESGSKIPFTSEYDDCIWTPEMVKKDPKNVLKSLQIPDGVKVELWTEPSGKGTLYGTYVGPVDIAAIDGNMDADSLIKSLKIKKVPHV